MNDLHVADIRYWLDFLIKSIIGIIISLVGLDYRQVKNSLKELEQSKYTLTTHVEVMQSEISGIKDRLERIEKKLDKVLEQ